MTTFKDWDNELDKLGTDELAKYNQALSTLLEWDFFKGAYDGFGLPIVNTMLTRATDARLRRDERRADVDEAARNEAARRLDPVESGNVDPCDLCTIGEKLRAEHPEGDRDIYAEACNNCNGSPIVS